MFDLGAIDRHFPHERYRDGQREAIEFVLQSYNDGKRIVILEAPTGAGKSAIGMTVADMASRAYYLTVTKMLQDQLIGEFGTEIVELKGRGSYPCTFWHRMGQRLMQRKLISQKKLFTILNSRPNCNEGYCKIDGNESDTRGNKCTHCFLNIKGETGSGFLQALPPGMQYSACPYYEQLTAATLGPKVVMNFAAFLNQMYWTQTLGGRDLLILDEIHDTEQILMDFVSLTLDDRLLSKYGYRLPEYEYALEYAIWFAQKDIVKLVGELRAEAKLRIREEADDVGKRRELTVRYDELHRLYTKLRGFMEHVGQQDSTEWVAEHSRVPVLHGGDGQPKYYNRVMLKPVFVKQFTQPLLLRHARHVLMMSATILNVEVLCNSLGLERGEVAAYRMKNRFPVANRPIFYVPAAKATGGVAKMPQWGPKIARGVDEIAAKYAGQRGIIHTHSFALADMLMENCAPEVRARFTYQKNFQSKQELLRYHEATDGSIIVAPAMHEGVDLPGDMSRFQILCKVPYPSYFENRQLSRRRELDPQYYEWITALKLVQSYGRSVRSETDSADTYIIDKAFANFYQRDKRLLPAWFREAVIWDGVTIRELMAALTGGTS